MGLGSPGFAGAVPARSPPGLCWGAGAAVGGGCAPAGCLCAVQGFGGVGGGRIVRGRPLGVCAPCGGGGRLGRFLLSRSGLGRGVVGLVARFGWWRDCEIVCLTSLGGRGGGAFGLRPAARCAWLPWRSMGAGLFNVKTNYCKDFKTE